MEQTMTQDTIVAVATAPGTGGIAVIRLSGPDAFRILERVWRGVPIEGIASHTAHLGRIAAGDEIVDEVVLTLFRAPNSFTGEDVAEISCHGSRWIQRQIVNLLIKNGARCANPGEFSQRAFMNGRIDLAQAEGIADLVAASSRAAHRVAMQQANGSLSGRLNQLRDSLVDLASLLELELDFSEEEVEFADRRKLCDLADETINYIGKLADSYSAGRAFKEGIPVVIAGEPNAGKSTLLNQLLEEDKAIVTDIPGTTRDIIEGTREIGGALFRFIDTAGLRDTDDNVERLGIERAKDRLKRAAIVLWTIDLSAPLEPQFELVASHRDSLSGIRQVILLNKSDLASDKNAAAADKISGFIKDLTFKTDTVGTADSNNMTEGNIPPVKIISISASEGTGIPDILDYLQDYAAELAGSDSDIMVTNARHYEALLRGKEALLRARAALQSGTDAGTCISADFIAQDIREAIHHLSTITGSISTPDLLQTIFSRFCIGK